MGTWGTGPFDGDLASDLRDDFKDLVAAVLAADDEHIARLLESRLL